MRRWLEILRELLAGLPVRNGLFMFGLATTFTLLVITLARGFNSETPTTEASEDRSPSCADLLGVADASDVTFKMVDTNQDVDTAMDSQEGFGSISLDKLAACLDPYKAIVIVEGLPDSPASGPNGVFNTRVYPYSLTGMGHGALVGVSGPYFEHGQCFVGNEGEPFQTKLSAVAPGIDLTIDVGVAGNLDPFMTVLGEGQYDVYHYQPSAFRKNAEIKVDSYRIEGKENPWAGVAVFQTTTYNSRKYNPYNKMGEFDPDNAAMWDGEPIYTMTVTVVCG